MGRKAPRAGRRRAAGTGEYERVGPGRQFELEEVVACRRGRCLP